MVSKADEAERVVRSDGPVGIVAMHLEELFAIRKHGSTISQELRAGLVTWVTMSYIVVVNPMILSVTSVGSGAPISFHAACRATCWTAAIATGFVGITANLPFGLAAGMGLNSYFRYGLVGKLGLGASGAFATCCVQAILFALLAITDIADHLQDLLPSSLKSAITVAIGVFQAFVGFQLMGLVVKSESTLVAVGDLFEPTLWLSLTGTLLVAALLIRKTKGALLFGIVFTTIAAKVLQLPNANEASAGTNVAIDGVSPNAFGWIDLDFNEAFEKPQEFATAVMCLLFIVLFDTAGVQFGMGQQAGLLDAEGRLPRAKYAYLGSALGTFLGALMGTSPVIIHNETAAGIQEGGRTGLTALTTAFLFLVSPIILPVIESIPPEATAPCLVLVGAMMMVPVRDIDFTDLRIALPAFLIICVTPLTYSISAGIFVGVAAYFVLSFVLRCAEATSAAGDAFAAAFFSTTCDMDGEEQRPWKESNGGYGRLLGGEADTALLEVTGERFRAAENNSSV